MTEVFEHDEPFYLSIGMTYEQYWYGDPWLVVSPPSCRKNALTQAQRNAVAARYVLLRGNLRCIALCFIRMQNAAQRLFRIREKPYPLTDEQTAEEREEREEREGENDRLRAELFFKNWAESTAKRFEKKE